MISFLVHEALMWLDVAAVLYAAATVRRKFWPARDALFGALATVVLFFAMATLSLLALGLTGWMRWPYVLAAHGAMAGLALVSCRRPAEGTASASPWSAGFIRNAGVSPLHPTRGHRPLDPEESRPGINRVQRAVPPDGGVEAKPPLLGWGRSGQHLANLHPGTAARAPASEVSLNSSRPSRASSHVPSPALAPVPVSVPVGVPVSVPASPSSRARAIGAPGPDDRGLAGPPDTGIGTLEWLAPRVVLVLLGGASLHALIIAPAAWDTYVYHLPLPIQWLQSGRIAGELTLPFYQRTCAYFPANAELVLFWLIAFLHSDLLAPLFNLALFPLSGLALVAIQWTLGVRRSTSIALAALFLLTPALVLSHLGTCSVDLYETFQLLCAAYFLLVASGPADLVLAGVALGLAVGVKYNALAFAALLVATWWWRSPGSREPGGRGPQSPSLAPLRGLPFLAVPAAALGGYWYLRNALDTGNPLYPWTAGLGAAWGLPGFDEFPPCSLAHMLAGGTATWSATVAPGLLGALGLPALVLGPAAILAVWLRWRRTPPGLARRHGLALLALVGPLLGLYLVTPTSGVGIMETWRYNLLGTALAYVCVGVCTEDMAVPESIVASAWLVLALSNAMDIEFRLSVAHKWRLLAGGALAAAWALWEHARPALARRRRFLALLPSEAVPAALAAALAALAGTYGFVHGVLAPQVAQARYREYAGGYLVPALDWLDAHPEATRAAFAGLARLLPFYGRDLSRELVYVNVDGTTGTHPHDYPGGRMRQRCDETAWLNAIQDSGARILLAGDDSPAMMGVPEEELWARAHPEVFRRVLDSPAIRIYEIRAQASVLARGDGPARASRVASGRRLDDI